MTYVIVEEQIHYSEVFSKTIFIDGLPERVWKALTEPAMMKQWMAQTEIDILTNWQPGEPMIIEGPWYKTKFRNTGTVVRFEPYVRLQYTHLSSLSRLPDEPGNYTLLDFGLHGDEGHTQLTLTITNFPTEAIYRHMAFYWNVTLTLLKNFIETGSILVNQ